MLAACGGSFHSFFDHTGKLVSIDGKSNTTSLPSDIGDWRRRAVGKRYSFITGAGHPGYIGRKSCRDLRKPPLSPPAMTHADSGLSEAHRHAAAATLRTVKNNAMLHPTRCLEISSGQRALATLRPQKEQNSLVEKTGNNLKQAKKRTTNI
jgi:hypothetical protein